MQNDLEYYVNELTPDELQQVKEYLLQAIANQKREYTPCETTPCFDDVWFSSDMREVEQYAHRFIQPKSVTNNY